MENSITITIPVKLSGSVIEGKAKMFISRVLSISDLINHANDIRHLPMPVKDLLTIGLNDMATTTNQIAFLTHLLDYYSSLLPKVDDGTLGDSNGVGIGNLDLVYNTKPLIEEVIFDLMQRLEVLGVDVGSDTFTATEFNMVSSALSKILTELDLVKAGNDILGELIEELQDDLKAIKSSMVIGKKSVYQRIAGVAATYAATKLADETFDAIKPSLVEIFKIVSKSTHVEGFLKALNQ